MLHEVDYQLWCPKCEHFKLAEHEDPCHDCLNEPVNDDGRKPVMFKEGDSKETGTRSNKLNRTNTQNQSNRSYGRKLSVTGRQI